MNTKLIVSMYTTNFKLLLEHQWPSQQRVKTGL